VVVEVAVIMLVRVVAEAMVVFTAVQEQEEAGLVMDLTAEQVAMVLLV
jgi:hypothetical protein